MGQFIAFKGQNKSNDFNNAPKDYYTKILKNIYPDKFFSNGELPEITETNYSEEFNKTLLEIWRTKETVEELRNYEEELKKNYSAELELEKAPKGKRIYILHNKLKEELLNRYTNTTDPTQLKNELLKKYEAILNAEPKTTLQERLLSKYDIELKEKLETELNELSEKYEAILNAHLQKNLEKFTAKSNKQLNVNLKKLQKNLVQLQKKDETKLKSELLKKYKRELKKEIPTQLLLKGYETELEKKDLIQLRDELNKPLEKQKASLLSQSDSKLKEYQARLENELKENLKKLKEDLEKLQEDLEKLQEEDDTKVKEKASKQLKHELLIKYKRIELQKKNPTQLKNELLEIYETKLEKKDLVQLRNKLLKIYKTELEGKNLEELEKESLEKYEAELNNKIRKDCLIGYIKADDLTIAKILRKIAEEESKYYYKFQEQTDIAIEDDKGEEILTELKRVSVVMYNKIYFDPIQLGNINNNLGEGDNKKEEWKNSEEKQIDPNSENYKFLPIAITNDSYFQYQSESYFGVYVNNDAKPLYLDTNEETKYYQYAKEKEEDGKEKLTYKKKDTYIYDCKTRLTGNDHAEHDVDTDKRYLYWLKHFVNKLAVKDKATKITTTVYRLNKETILKNINMGHTNEQEENKTNAQVYAEDQAQLLPTKYKCFYYTDNNGELQSFLSSVNIGEGRGGSGYGMRADRIDEVDYRWVIPNMDKEWLPYAELMAYYMDLDHNKRVDIKPATQDLFPTNWPTHKERNVKGKSTILESNSWVEYYKQFKEYVKRKNNPTVKPYKTRTLNSDTNIKDINKYNTKDAIYNLTEDNEDTYNINSKSNAPILTRRWTALFGSIKSPNRVEQKGENLQGVSLGKNENDRLDAATEMASALKKFHFYEDIKQKDPKITDSRLPATSFAKYVVSTDKMVKTQWVQDNIGSPDSGNGSTLDISGIDINSVRTDQEWCHLLGHGDGGIEELGNFVSGSKHCNTEQLAIEIGQRKITHSKSYNKEIKARITAYLMPNEGTWMPGNYSRENIINELIKGIDIDNEEEFWTKVLNIFKERDGIIETNEEASNNKTEEINVDVSLTATVPDIPSTVDIEASNNKAEKTNVEVSLTATVTDIPSIVDIVISIIDSFFVKSDHSSSSYKLRRHEKLQNARKTLVEEIRKKYRAIIVEPEGKGKEKEKGGENSGNIPSLSDKYITIKKAARMLLANLNKNYFLDLPLARRIRYRHYYNNQKVFDHIFDGQSESLDYNECQILDYTVERVLYIATGKKKEYNALIRARVQDLIPTPEEYECMKKTLDIINGLDEFTNNLELERDRDRVQDLYDKGGAGLTPEERVLIAGLIANKFNEIIKWYASEIEKLQKAIDGRLSPTDDIVLKALEDLKGDLEECKKSFYPGGGKLEKYSKKELENLFNIMNRHLSGRLQVGGSKKRDEDLESSHNIIGGHLEGSKKRRRIDVDEESEKVKDKDISGEGDTEVKVMDVGYGEGDTEVKVMEVGYGEGDGEGDKKRNLYTLPYLSLVTSSEKKQGKEKEKEEENQKVEEQSSRKRKRQDNKAKLALKELKRIFEFYKKLETQDFVGL